MENSEKFKITSHMVLSKHDDKIIKSKPSSNDHLNKNVEKRPRGRPKKVHSFENVDLKPKTEKASRETEFLPGSLAILTKIIDYMRKCFINNDKREFSLKQLFEELNLETPHASIWDWLLDTALPEHVNVCVIEAGAEKRFAFKPKYHLTSAEDFLRLLKYKDDNGLGGTLHRHVKESLPNYKKNIAKVTKQINIRIYRNENVYEYKEKPRKFSKNVQSVLDEFDQLKLQNDGNSSNNFGFAANMKLKNIPINKKIKDNDHLLDLLCDYSSSSDESSSITIKKEIKEPK